MKLFCRTALFKILAFSLMLSVSGFVSAQSPRVRNNLRQQQQLQQQQQQMQQRVTKEMQKIADSQAELASDPKLLLLQREYIAKSEKLAVEFERKKQYKEAREVYESLLRLVPKYTKANEGLQRVLTGQTSQDRKVLEVHADQAWQDSGVTLQKGMPVHLEIRGTWKVVYETGPEGIDIPREQMPRDSRIKLGTLLGVIVTSPAELETAKPFIMKPDADFIAERTGRLFVRMFDIDPSDNEGKLMVMVQSTFAR